MRMGTAVRVVTHLFGRGSRGFTPRGPIITIYTTNCNRHPLPPRGIGVKIPVKCSTPGCHRRKKVSPEELQMLRTDRDEAGRRAGLICPGCVKKAFENPEEYDMDIPLGELLVEAAKETPRWRVCFNPEGLRS